MVQRSSRLKWVHLADTAWFMLCIGYILVLALRQAGVRWWVIFSLLGHSALVIFLLVSLYLFAIFRGVSGNQKIEAEHPLTSTDYYRVFYVATPLLGGLAGILGTIGVNIVSQFLLGIALGTLGTTFLVWVIVDPMTGLLETFLSPSSRRHRAERLARVKTLREKRRQGRERLLAEVLAKDELARRRWQEVLMPQAQRLAELLAANGTDFKRAEREAIDMGVNAWQIGELSCMRQLQDMTMEICRKKCKDLMVADYLCAWWDGIGSWRNPSLLNR